eukprot:16015-Heterococcus_DN1.PRE.1
MELTPGEGPDLCTRKHSLHGATCCCDTRSPQDPAIVPAKKSIALDAIAGEALQIMEAFCYDSCASSLLVTIPKSHGSVRTKDPQQANS